MTNKNVLITGCTSGIGYELVKQYAKNDYNIVLVARNYNKLIKLQEELQSEFHIKTYIIEKDLTQVGAAEDVYNKVKELNLSIDIVCNNAGTGLYGSFEEHTLKQYNDMIQLNITSLMELTYYFIKDMMKANSGRILNIASTGSFVPGPYMAVYYATKAFVLSFSEAIAMELKDTNISVTCVCPGPTKTEFFQKATDKDVNLLENMKAMTSKEVAEYAYKKVEKRSILGITGFKNKLAIFGNRFISRKVSRKIIYNIQYNRGKSKIK